MIKIFIKPVGSRDGKPIDPTVLPELKYVGATLLSFDDAVERLLMLGAHLPKVRKSPDTFLKEQLPTAEIAMGMLSEQLTGMIRKELSADMLLSSSETHHLILEVHRNMIEPMRHYTYEHKVEMICG